MSEQKRLESLMETCINVFIGFWISLSIWPAVAWLYGIPYSYSSNIGITLIFTVASVGRGYVVRRFFARGLHQIAVRWARAISRSRWWR